MWLFRAASARPHRAARPQQQPRGGTRAVLDASDACVVPVVPFGSFAASAPVQTVMTNPNALSYERRAEV